MVSSSMEPRSKTTQELTAGDLRRAELFWLKEVQRTLAQESKFDSWKKQFDLFVDGDGLLRCKGRLGNADLPVSVKHPILLPKDHHLAVLVVKDTHERVGHNDTGGNTNKILVCSWKTVCETGDPWVCLMPQI